MNKYDGCYPRGEYTIIDKKNKGGFNNCFKVRHVELKKELYYPDDPKDTSKTVIKRWIKKFGDPRKSNVDPVSWIEKIPIKETRLYVKYVLSNMQIYRQMNKKSKNKSLISRKNSI